MKVLIIRFSAIGDVAQCLSAAQLIKNRYPQASITWVTREDLRELLESQSIISEVISLPRRSKLFALWQLFLILQRSKWTHIYDAHNNLRSKILIGLMRINGLLSMQRIQFLHRSNRRWSRFILFVLRGRPAELLKGNQWSFIEPLKNWGIVEELPNAPVLFSSAKLKSDLQLPNPPFTVLCPSAAHSLKRWPLDSWRTLMQLMPNNQFVLLGGPEDLERHRVFNEIGNCLNLTGQLSLLQSAKVIQMAKAVVSNDTGMMHFAEQMGVPTVALMGPAPLGRPSRPSTQILEVALACRPCSKHGQGPCFNKTFQKCLTSINPETVRNALSDV